MAQNGGDNNESRVKSWSCCATNKCRQDKGHGSRQRDKGYIMAGGQVVETVEDFCYLGSVMSDNSSCDKDIKTKLGKANSVFGRLNSIWKSGSSNCNVKVRLHDSLVLSTLLYAAETWSMTVANMRKLEASNHKWQIRILGVVCRD